MDNLSISQPQEKNKPANLDAGLAKSLLSPGMSDYPQKVSCLHIGAVKKDRLEFIFLREYYTAMVKVCDMELELRTGPKAAPDEQ